jgi:hypothetical protein
MSKSLRWARRGSSFGVALVMLAVAIAVPALEDASRGPHPVLESEHSPASCPPGHDHTICTQVEANAPLTGSAPRYEAHEGVAVIRAVGLSTAHPRRALRRGHSSRAPPAV